jgi:predicted dehydrogenase
VIAESKHSLGVAVIGRGFGQLVHVPALEAIEDVRLIGDGGRSWHDLVESPEVSAVIIATPPASHSEIALAALKAGKAVLCEKPLAASVAEARRMLEQAERSGRIHMTDFEFREFAAWRVAKKMIHDGVLGQLRHVNIHWIVSSWSSPERHWSWKTDRELGGGVLSALGVHVFDYVEWLLGPIATISAMLCVRIPSRPGASGERRAVTAEDYAQLHCRLDDGVPVSCVLSNVAPYTKGHWVEIYGESKALVFGSSSDDYGKGFEVWIGKQSQLEKIATEDAPRDRFADGRILPFMRLAKRFIAAVENDSREHQPSFREGLRAQVLMQAAIQSSQEGACVDVK